MAVKKIGTLNKHENPATNEDEFDIENYMNVNWDKIKEVVDNNADELTTAQGKVTTLETDNTTNKQDISSLKSRTTTLETDNETNKTNISTLQEDVEEIEGNIHQIQQEQTAQNQKIQELDDNQIHITTEKADNLNIQDCSGQNAKINVFGISKQETRSGYNLLDVPEVLEISIFKEIEVNLKANNTYTFKFNNAIAGSDNNVSMITFRNTTDVITKNLNTSTTKKIEVQPTQDITNVRIYASTDYSSSVGKTKTFQKLMIYKGIEDKDYEQYGASPSPEYPSEIENVGDNINVFDISKITSGSIVINNNDGTLTIKNNPNTNGYVQQTKKLSELCPDLKVGDIATLGFKTTTKNSSYANSIYVGEAWNNGTYKTITQSMLDFQVGFYGGYNEISLINDIKIEKDTKVTSYSKYKCGSIGITVCNKNWLKVQNSNNSSLGLTWNVSEEERKITGTATGTYSQSSQQDCEIPAGSYKFEYETNNNNVTYGIWLINSTGQIIATIRGKNSATINETVVKYALFIENTVANTSYNITLKAMLLNTVTEDKTFVPHKEQAITFPLGEGQRLYNGDYLASDGIHHKRTQVVINGTETDWIYYSANDTWARPYVLLLDKKIGESNNTANALCNKAKSISWEDMAAGLNEYAIFTYEGDNRISISVKKEDLETLDIDGVKKYFQENNMVVEYNLEEEEIEPYTPEQQEAYNKLQNVLSYYNVTNVFTDKAQLVFKYIADTKTYVDNETNSIKEQLNTIKELLSTTTTSAMLLDNMQTDLESEVL